MNVNVEHIKQKPAHKNIVTGSIFLCNIEPVTKLLFTNEYLFGFFHDWCYLQFLEILKTIQVSKYV